MEPSTSSKRSRNNEDDESSIKRVKPDLGVSTSEVIERRNDNYVNEKENYIRARDGEEANERRNDIEVNENENGTRPRLEEESGQQRNDIDDNNENENDIRIREQEEAHFLRLFTMILNDMISLKCLKDESISEGLKEIKSSFRKESNLKFSKFSALDFTKWEYVCGYLYCYGSHGAGFARSRTIEVIRNCTELKEIVKKSELKIISLGSGPGNDTVGFCSALSELQNLKSLKLTLVDKFKEWLPCINLAKIFIQEGNFGKVSEIFQKANVELSFIQTDLTVEDLSGEDYFERLAEADIIVMSKLVTTLDRTDKNKHQRIIIKSLHDHMREDAVILLLDSCFEELWYRYNFCRVYKYGDKNKDEFKYMSSAMAERRFCYNDAIPSILPIHVLVKKKK